MKLFFTLLSSLLLGAFAHAQVVVSGTVKDEATGQPLQGASVLAKGNRGTITDAGGAFTLSLPADVRSIFVSYVGYVEKEVSIANGATGLQVMLTASNAITDVVVTGSRNLSRTRTQTPVAVDVIPVSQLVNEVGQVDVNQILNYVAPSFQSARQTISDGTDHIDPAQLRGLGTDQILVLVNGKRRHQSALVNVNGTVNRGQVGTDLSAIPATAIERIEVLRDGAAAQYGSDAIAGVINIVLKTGTGVLSGNMSYGTNITAYPKNFALNTLTNKPPDEEESVTDGGTLQGGLNYGFKIGSGGYLNLNAEMIRRDLTNRTGTYTGAVYPNVGGANRDDSIMNARGLDRNFFDMRIGQSQMHGGSLFANSMLPLGGSWSLQIFGGYSKKEGEAAGFYRYPSSINSGAGTYRTNALALYPDGFLPLIQTNIQDISLSAGLVGKLGTWNATLSNTFGTNTLDYTVSNSINYTQFNETQNPQTEFDAGGIKFLQNTVNADVSRKYDVAKGLNLAFGAEYRIDQYGQTAGEEASYRNYNTSSGAAAGAQVFAGFTPPFANTNSRKSVALYTDNEIDVTDKLMFGAALRFENYSDFGSTLNYKVASRFNVVKGFTLRAAHSTGFRAPSMQQRFYAKTNTLFVSGPSGLVPTESGTFPNDSRPAEILGIPSLKEETSKSYSAGFTANPFRGFELTFDAYQIDIEDRIVLTNNFTGGTDANLTAELNAAGAQTANFFTNAIDTRNRGIEVVASYNWRMAVKHQFGITAAATFIDNEVKKDSDGKPIIKASPELVASGQLGNYFNREDQSRIEVANPKSKGNLMLTYKNQRFNALVRFAYFGEVTYLDPTINPAAPANWPVNAFTGNRETLDQTFSNKTVTDISAGLSLIKNFTLTVGVNNLFDVYQDRHNHANNMSLGRFIYSRRVQQMGFNGRYVFARLAFNVRP